LSDFFKYSSSTRSYSLVDVRHLELDHPPGFVRIFINRPGLLSSSLLTAATAPVTRVQIAGGLTDSISPKGLLASTFAPTLGKSTNVDIRQLIGGELVMRWCGGRHRFVPFVGL